MTCNEIPSKRRNWKTFKENNQQKMGRFKTSHNDLQFFFVANENSKNPKSLSGPQHDWLNI